MLKNDKVNLVIALLVAIGLWMYVMVEVNPEKDSPMKDIPITFLNEETLTDDGLTLLSVSDRNVDVNVKGRVSDLKGVKKDDIKIFADLEGYKAGEHTIRLQIGKIDNVEIECKQKITIVIDELVTAEKPVQVSIVGDMSDDSEPYIVQVNPQVVKVTGAKTLVESIAYIDAPLNVDKVGNDLKAFTVALHAENASGMTVEDVSLDTASVSVSAVNLNKKTVRLDVPIYGQDVQNLERIVTVPKTITIKGMDMDLAQISSIMAEPVNVADIYEDTSIPVVPILPEGVEAAANSQELQVQVTVKGMGSRSFEYSKDAIIAEGVAEDMTVAVEDVNIQLTVTGRETVTEYLTKDDFIFAVNVKDLKPGTHQVEMECRYEKDLLLAEFEPKLITLVITSGTGEPDAGTDGAEAPDSDSGAEAGTEPDAETGSDEQTDSGAENEAAPEA